MIAALCDVFDDTNLSDCPEFSPDDLANTIISLFVISDQTAHLLSTLMKSEIEQTSMY